MRWECDPGYFARVGALETLIQDGRSDVADRARTPLSPSVSRGGPLDFESRLHAT